MQNVRICKIMNIIIIIMNITMLMSFIYCITYLLNRYMEIVWTVQELRFEVRITSEDLYVHSDCIRNEKKI